MLNQLVESKNHQQENARKNGFIVGTFGVLVAVLMSGWTYSLFAKNYGMGTGDLELSSIVAPVAAAEEPPKPEPEPFKPERTNASLSDKIILKALYDDVSSPKNPPKETRGEKDVVSATKFNLSDVKLGDVNQIPESAGRTGATVEPGCGLCGNNPGNRNAEKEKEEEAPKLAPKPTPEPAPKKIDRPVSLGVINGKATYLGKPAYSAAARSMGITGAVHVQVLIDEQGNVVSASIVSGHPLLRPGVENAARQSKFTPTKLSNQPVKVTGVIVYQFKP
jgi:protein TonB